MANGVSHDGSKGGAELLSNSESDGTLVSELPRQCDAHVHAYFKHDEIVNLSLECAQSLVVEQKRFWKLSASVSPKGYRGDCTCEDVKLETGASPWSRRALRSKLFNRIGEPVPCRTDVDSRTTIDQPIKVVMVFKVHRVLNEQRLQVTDLMVGDILYNVLA